MSEIQDLEYRIGQLQRELEQQKREAARMREQLSKDNLRKLQEYEREMQAGMNHKDLAARKEYERLLKEYEQNSDYKMQQTYLEMNTQYQKLLSDIKNKEQEWHLRHRELESHIKKLKSDAKKKEALGIAEANRYMYDTGVVYKEIDKKPHEKFFPNRIKAFYDAISDARNLSRGGLNEAAIAIFISTQSGLNRLGFDIDEQCEEWLRLYNIFKSKTRLFRMNLDYELEEWEVNAVLNIDYWTDGKYLMMNERLTLFETELKKIEKNGTDEYLKKSGGYDIDTLKNGIEELDRMSTEFEKLKVLSKARYKASCERANWGESIIEYFEDELNLIWMEKETHFRFAAANKAEKNNYRNYMTKIYGEDYEKVDTREWLEITFKNPNDIIISIYIVPYEKDEQVENRIVLNIDYPGAENSDYSRTIYSHICESISLFDDGIINYASDVEQLKNNLNKTLRDTGISLSDKLKRIRVKN